MINLPKYSPRNFVAEVDSSLPIARFVVIVENDMGTDAVVYLIDEFPTLHVVACFYVEARKVRPTKNATINAIRRYIYGHVETFLLAHSNPDGNVFVPAMHKY